jgi:hypothetical protein
MAFPAKPSTSGLGAPSVLWWLLMNESIKRLLKNSVKFAASANLSDVCKAYQAVMSKPRRQLANPGVPAR